MALITRAFTFVDGTTAYGSQVDSEIANIVNTLNNLDSVALKWDQISVLNNANVPLTLDISSGTQHVADFKVNGTIKTYIGSDGNLVLTTPDGTKTFRLYVDNNGVFNTLELT